MESQQTPLLSDLNYGSFSFPLFFFHQKTATPDYPQINKKEGRCGI